MAESKRKRGRKPIADAERRKHAVTCRLTDAEAEHIDRLRGGMSRGEWLRLAALKRPPRVVPEANREAWAELARLAANLNQHQRAINEGHAEAAPAVDLAELRGQVQALRRELLGVSDES